MFGLLQAMYNSGLLKQFYAHIIVAQVLVILSKVPQSSCSSCPEAPNFGVGGSAASSVITLTRASLGNLQTIVTPDCLTDNLTLIFSYGSSSRRPVSLIYTIKRYGHVDCNKAYLIISGNITGPGTISINNDSNTGLNTTDKQFSYLAGNGCSDLTISYYTSYWIPKDGPTIELFYAETNYCDDVLRKCSVTSSHENVCLPREWRCNERADCPDGIDESQCLSCCTQLGNAGVCVSPDSCRCEPIRFYDSIPATIEGCNGATLTTEFKKRDVIGWHSVVSKWPQVLPLNRSYQGIYFYDDVNFTIAFNKIVVGERDTVLFYYHDAAIDLSRMKSGDKKSIFIKKNHMVTLSFVMMSPYSIYNFTYTDDVNYIVGAAPCDYRYSRSCDYGGRDLCYTLEQSCNEYMDCANGRDEKGCGSVGRACGKEEIMCAGDDSKQNCFNMSQRCDGNRQCSNGYDERGCDSTLCGTHNGTYLCSDTLCIFETWMCDKTKDCADGEDEQRCEGTSLKVVTASVIGSLVCAIMIVIAVGCSCKLHTHRLYESIHHRSRYESPMTRITNELMRRAAPPPYAEAMQRSRPFEEVQSEYLAALAQHRSDETPQDSGGILEEERSIASASGTLDIADRGLVEVSDDNTVSYRRNPNKPPETTEHNMNHATTALEQKSEDEEGDTNTQPASQSFSDNTESVNNSPSRRQVLRHNSVDSDVSLLSRDSDDAPLLT